MVVMLIFLALELTALIKQFDHVARVKSDGYNWFMLWVWGIASLLTIIAIAEMA